MCSHDFDPRSVLCSVCVNPKEYYDDNTKNCKTCPETAGRVAAACGLFIGLALLCGALWYLTFIVPSTNESIGRTLKVISDFLQGLCQYLTLFGISLSPEVCGLPRHGTCVVPVAR